MANQQASIPDPSDVPDPEVPATAHRRTFPAAYKLRILAEADAATKRGQIGALLRREGLYSSHLDKWRRQRARGTLAALAEHPRGRKPTRDPRDEELVRLRRENARLQARLATAETIIDVQKKVSQLLGLTDPAQ